MGYYNYHAAVRKALTYEKLIKVEIVESYHNISPCMVLYFQSHRPMPIREHKWEEYIALISKIYGDDLLP